MAEDILKKTITVADLQKLVSAWDGATGDDRVNYVGTDWADQITKAVAVLKSNKFYNAPPDTFITVEQLFAGAPQSVQQKLSTLGSEAIMGDKDSPIRAFLNLNQWEQMPAAPGSPKDLNEALTILYSYPTKDSLIDIIGTTALLNISPQLFGELSPDDAFIYRELVGLLNNPNIAPNQVIPNPGKYLGLVQRFAQIAYNPQYSRSILTDAEKKALTPAALLGYASTAVRYLRAQKAQKAKEEEIKEKNLQKENEAKLAEAIKENNAAAAEKQAILDQAQKELKENIDKQAAEQDSAVARAAAEASPAEPQAMPTAEQIEARIQEVEAVYNKYQEALAAGDEAAVNAALAEASAMNLPRELMDDPSGFLETVAEARAYKDKLQQQSADDTKLPAPNAAPKPAAPAAPAAAEQSRPKPNTKDAKESKVAVQTPREPGAPVKTMQTPAQQPSAPAPVPATESQKPEGEAAAPKSPVPTGRKQPTKATQVGTAFQGMAQAVTDASADRAKDLARRIESFQAGNPDPQDANRPVEDLLQEYRVFARKEWQPNAVTNEPAPPPAPSKLSQPEKTADLGASEPSIGSTAADIAPAAEIDSDLPPSGLLADMTQNPVEPPQVGPFAAKSLFDKPQVGDGPIEEGVADLATKTLSTDEQKDLAKEVSAETKAAPRITKPVASGTKPTPEFRGVKTAFKTGELYTILNAIEEPDKPDGLLRRTWERLTGDQDDPKQALKERFRELTGESYNPAKADEYRVKYLSRDTGIKQPEIATSAAAQAKQTAKQAKSPADQTKDISKDQSAKAFPRVPSEPDEITKQSLVTKPGEAADTTAVAPTVKARPTDDDPLYLQAREEVWQAAILESDPNAQFVRNDNNQLVIANPDGTPSTTLVVGKDIGNAQTLFEQADQRYAQLTRTTQAEQPSDAETKEEDTDKAPIIGPLSIGAAAAGHSASAQELRDILNTDTTRSTATVEAPEASAQDLSALRAAEARLAETAASAEAAAKALDTRKPVQTIATIKARNEKRVKDAYHGLVSGIVTGNAQQRREAIKNLVRGENPYVDYGKDFREAKEYVARHAAKYANAAYNKAVPVAKNVVRGTGVFAVKVIKSPYTVTKRFLEKSKKRSKLLGYLVDTVVSEVKDFAGNVKEIYTTAKAVIKDTRIFKATAAQLSSIKTGVYSAAEGAATTLGSKYASAMKLVNGIRYHAGKAYQVVASAGATVMKGYQIGKAGVKALGSGAVTGGLIMLGTGNPLIAGAAALLSTGVGTVNNLYNSTSKYSLLAGSSHNRFFDSNGRLLDLRDAYNNPVRNLQDPNLLGPIDAETELARSLAKQGGIYSRWQRFIRIGNAGMFGAAIGTAIGGLIGGPGALIGGAVGFGVFAGGRALIDTVYSKAVTNLALNQELLGSKLLGKIANLPFMSVLNSTMANSWLIEQADIIREKGIQRYMAEDLAFTNPNNNFQAFLALSNYLGAIGYVQSSVALTNFLAAGAIRTSLGIQLGEQIGIRAAFFNPVSIGVLVGSTLGMFLSGYLFGFGTGTVIGATVGGIIGAAAGASIIAALGLSPIGWVSFAVFAAVSAGSSTLGGWFGSLFNQAIDKGMDSIFGAINRISAMLKLLQILFSGAFQAGDMVTLTLALIPLLAALGKAGSNSANSDCTDPADCENQVITSESSQLQLAEMELAYYNTVLVSEHSAWTPAMMETAIASLERAGEDFYGQGRTIYLAIGGDKLESYYDEQMIVIAIPIETAYDQVNFAASLQQQFGQLELAIKPDTSAMLN